MKWKEIFKLWHFWTIVILLSTFYVVKETNNAGFLSPGVISGSISAGFLFPLILYSLGWLIFGRGKKQ